MKGEDISQLVQQFDWLEKNKINNQDGRDISQPAWKLISQKKNEVVKNVR